MKHPTYLSASSLLLGIFCLVSHGLFAQSPPYYANTKNWKYLASEHFDVYFQGGQEALAQRSARFAELACFEISEIYDYRPQSRYALYLLEDAAQLGLTHSQLDQPRRAPGQFSIPRLEAHVVHPGTTHGLYQEVKRSVAGILLREFAYGNRLGQAIQNQLLLDHSRWYSQGLVEYVGTGWSYTDEMWLQSTVGDQLEDVLDQTLEGNSEISKIFRKSVWRYVANEYGEQKLAEIIYLVNISHSLESGIISVLGITLNTLTVRWRESLKDMVDHNASGRMSLGNIKGLEEIPTKKGYHLVAFAYHEKTKQYALYLNKMGKHTLFLYDSQSATYTQTAIQSSYANLVTEGTPMHYPIAWSPDGSRLVTTRYRGHKYDMVYYEVGSKEIAVEPVIGAFGRVLHINWSHNGQLLALSALAKNTGTPQLFVGVPQSGNYRQVTEDPYDNLEPCWSYDDASIFFSSNRDTNRLVIQRPRWDNYAHSFDIFQYNRSEPTDTVVQITFTPATNERKPLTPNSFEVYFITDESGILNLSKYNPFIQKNSYITDLPQGIVDFYASDEQLVFCSPIDGQHALFQVAPSGLRVQPLTELTLLRTEYLTYYNEQVQRDLKRQLQEAEARAADSLQGLTPSETPSTEPVEEPQTPPNPPVEEPEKEEKKARYYIFDDYDTAYEVKEAEDKVFEKREKELNRPSLLSGLIPTETPKPDMGGMKVSGPQASRTKWAADYLQLELGRRPDAGLYTTIGASFSDQFHNQELKVTFTPYLDFQNFRGRNVQGNITYRNLGHRLDFYAGMQLLTRHYRRRNVLFPVDSAIFRYDNLNFSAGVTYPLSNFSALTLDLGGHMLTRKDQKLLNQELLDQENTLAHAALRFTVDKIKQWEGYNFQGMSLQANAASYYSLKNSAIAFHTIDLQWRNYFPIHKKIVLANQLSAGMSLGARPQQFYLGGMTDWVPPYVFFEDSDQRLSKENAISTDLLDFSFQRFTMPMRGFWFYSRRGSKFMSLNTELRIPLSRLAKHSLNTSPLYNMELIPFLDVGSVWTNGNPFSSKNPTDTQLVGSEPVIVELQTLKSPFLFGTGVGFRTNFIGYSLRVDVAWGIDDQNVQAPALSLSMGKRF